MLGHISPFLFAVRNETSPYPILTRYPNVLTAARMVCLFGGYKPIYLGCCPFTIIFDLNCGQEVRPILMSQGTIFLLIILQIILHI